MKKICLPALLAATMLLSLVSCTGEETLPQEESPFYNPPAPTTPAPPESGSDGYDDNDLANEWETRLAQLRYFTDFAGGTTTDSVFGREAPVHSPFSGVPRRIFEYDVNSDIIYFVNFGRFNDNYIYARKDGENELILEMQANYLTLNINERNKRWESKRRK